MPNTSPNILDEMLAEKFQRAEQNYRVAAQEFYDELCRASQRRAAQEGVELGNFVVPRGCRTKQEKRQNLFVVVGFGPVVYNGMHNILTSYAPDGTWSALLRTITSSGYYTPDREIYRWYSHAPRYQLYPGHKSVKPVRLKVGLALLEEE